MQVKAWPTPRAQDDHPNGLIGNNVINESGRMVTASGKDYGLALSDAVKQWPTAKESDAKGSGSHGTGGGQTCGLASSAGRNWPTPSTEDGKTDGPKSANRMFTDDMKTSDQRLRNFVQAWATPRVGPHGEGGGRE